MLFTESFVERVLQEARNDNVLSKSDKKLAEANATAPVVHDSEAVVGARFCDFAENWHSIIDEQWALSTVKEGLLIDFVALPVQKVFAS